MAYMNNCHDFCRLLGWDAPCRTQLPNGVVFYESGSFDNALFQINTLPCWSGCIYAPRYAICSGWYSFSLREDDETKIFLPDEHIDRLSFYHFSDEFHAAAYRERYPECSGFSDRTYRENGPYKLLWSDSQSRYVHVRRVDSA